MLKLLMLTRSSWGFGMSLGGHMPLWIILVNGLALGYWSIRVFGAKNYNA